MAPREASQLAPTRFLSSPFIIMEPFFLLFWFDKETPK